MADDRNPPALLFHLSDIHFGLEDNTALDWVEREIAARLPQAVAITGDLTMRARHREFAAACRWIRALEAPVTVEVGNHDMPYFNLVERFVAPYRRFRAIEGLKNDRPCAASLTAVNRSTSAESLSRYPFAPASRICVTYTSSACMLNTSTRVSGT